VTQNDDVVGPVDYLVVEFPGNRFNGQIVPSLVDLIARGLVRIIDLAFVTKDGNGGAAIVEIEDLDEASAGPLRGLLPFLCDLVGEEDLLAAADALAPNSSALIVVWENTWAAPFATAVRASGGEVVASGRIPAGDLLAALDA
jgi:hypothetical protein